MKLETLGDFLRLGLPLLVLGFVAGALRVAAQRTPDLGRKKLLTFAWIALLLVGAPVWLFFATALGIL